MYLENLRSDEMERIAYLTGDTMAATAFGSLDETRYEVQRLEYQIEELETKNSALRDKYDDLLLEAVTAGAAETLASALQTIATCYQHPGKPTRKQLDAMTRTIIEITARPGDYTPESARQAIYAAFGHDV